MGDHDTRSRGEEDAEERRSIQHQVLGHMQHEHHQKQGDEKHDEQAEPMVRASSVDRAAETDHPPIVSGSNTKGMSGSIVERSFRGRGGVSGPGPFVTTTHLVPP